MAEKSTITSIIEEEETVKEMTNKSWKARILGDIYTENDPKLLPRYKKYFYVFIVAVVGINQSISILIYMPGIYQMMADLNTSVTGFDASTSIYIAFAGIAVRSNHITMNDTNLFLYVSHCFGLV